MLTSVTVHGVKTRHFVLSR